MGKHYIGEYLRPPATPYDYAYVAGFFDGEGTISLGHKGSPSIRCQIGNTNREIIEFIAFLFPASIGLRARSNKKHKTCWNWDLSGFRAEIFLIAILPYLRVKKPQALVALEYQRTKTKYTGRMNPVPQKEQELRHRFRKQLADLNFKGIKDAQTNAIE